MKRFVCIIVLAAFVSGASGFSPLRERLKSIVACADARVGIAVIVDGRDTLTVNNDERYPLMSVMKFHQALAVAHWLEQHDWPLTQQVYISRESLHPDTYSPLRERYPEGNVCLPVDSLLTYTLQLSDNNACDILFDYIGGVKAANDFLQTLGVAGFRIGATEDEMHRCSERCNDNEATPLSVALLLDKLAADALPIDTAYTHFIRQTMLACQTGGARLPQPLQDTDARIGHKTGTSDRDAQGRLTAVNDAGFVLLPDGRRYAIAVMVADSAGSLPAVESIIAMVSEAVYRAVGASYGE